MPASCSAPNSRCAVPGTPIMPAPSRLTSATSRMLVMPLTSSPASGAATIVGARFGRREGVADADRDVLLDRGRHGLRVDDFRAEIGELHGLAVRKRGDDLARPAPGPGSADSTPLTSVQITISRAPSRAPKIDAEKSLPLRPSVVCSPRVSLATKPGITSTPASSRGDRARRPFSRDSAHCTPGPERPPLHDDDRRGRRASAPRGRERAPAGNAANRRLDHSSPNPATRSRMSRPAERTSATACSRRSRSPTSAPKRLDVGARLRGAEQLRRRSPRAGPRRRARLVRQSSRLPRLRRPITRLIRASVTPRHADSTSATRGSSSPPTIPRRAGSRRRPRGSSRRTCARPSAGRGARDRTNQPHAGASFSIRAAVPPPAARPGARGARRTAARSAARARRTDGRAMPPRRAARARPPCGSLRVAIDVDDESAPLDQAEVRTIAPSARVRLTSMVRFIAGSLRAWWRWCVRAGTSGQTLAAGSMRQWTNSGPAWFSSASTASSTCDARSTVSASMPKERATLGEVRVVGEVDLAEAALEEQLLPLSHHAERLVVDQQDLDRQPVALERRELLDVDHDRAVAAHGDRGAPRVGEVRADRGRQAVAHRAEAAARQVALGPPDQAVLRDPHLVLADVAGEGRFAVARRADRRRSSSGA